MVVRESLMGANHDAVKHVRSQPNVDHLAFLELAGNSARSSFERGGVSRYQPLELVRIKAARRPARHGAVLDNPPRQSAQTQEFKTYPEGDKTPEQAPHMRLQVNDGGEPHPGSTVRWRGGVPTCRRSACG